MANLGKEIRRIELPRESPESEPLFLPSHPENAPEIEPERIPDAPEREPELVPV